MSADLMIEVSGLSATTISATNEARYARDELLGEAKQVTVVDSAESAVAAAETLKNIKTLTRQVEVGRKGVKEPVLDLAKRIDGLARELSEELESEANRISRVLGAYQAEQNKKIEEARRKAWEEEQRIVRDAQEKERLEQKRIADEAEALRLKAEAAKTPAAKAKLEEKATALEQKGQDQADQRAAETEKAIIDTRVSAVAHLPPKPAGVATRSEMMFEVTDIAALYEAAPYMVTLTPNAAAIKAALKGLQGNQTLPGVRHWVEQKTIVR